MEQFDPAMAERVWQRVQASLKTGADPTPLPPPSLRVYTVPPEAWRETPVPSKPLRKKIRRTQPSPESLPWVWLVLLFLLLNKHNC